MKKGHTFMPVSMQELRSIVLDTIAAAGRPAEGEVSPPSTVSFSEFSSERFQEAQTIICQDRLRTSAATTKSSKLNQRRFSLVQAYFVRYWLSAGRGNFNVSPAGCTPPNFYVVRNLRLSW
jgi:hypothetical protein